jgi:hypothetical protein
MAQLGGTPVLILREGSERTRGKDAQSRNIMAAKTFNIIVGFDDLPLMLCKRFIYIYIILLQGIYV